MILAELDKIDLQELQRLCAEKCPESLTLDFKRSVPGNSDRDKQEILKDVCAMANSDGGDLVYGIDEASGSADSICPIVAETEDSVRLRFGQLIDAGIEPRLVGLRMHVVNVENGFVLIVRVPASFDGPHRYRYNTGLSKFVMRNGTHTSELTFDQLRSAFDRTATLGDRARQFRAERLNLIVERETAMPMMVGPICAVHLIPIGAMSGSKQIDVRRLYNDISRLMFSDWGGARKSLNLDGVVAYPMIENGTVSAFTQVFRNGSIEIARHGGMLASVEHDRIPSRTVSEFFRDATIRTIATALSIGHAGPAILGWAMLDVENSELVTGGFSHGRTPRADRKTLVLPELWLENIGAIDDVDVIARPMMDMLWQCFGVETCWEYDERGRWKASR